MWIESFFFTADQGREGQNWMGKRRNGGSEAVGWDELVAVVWAGSPPLQQQPLLYPFLTQSSARKIACAGSRRPIVVGRLTECKVDLSAPAEEGGEDWAVRFINIFFIHSFHILMNFQLIIGLLMVSRLKYINLIRISVNLQKVKLDGFLRILKEARKHTDSINWNYNGLLRRKYVFFGGGVKFPL